MQAMQGGVKILNIVGLLIFIASIVFSVFANLFVTYFLILLIVAVVITPISLIIGELTDQDTAANVLGWGDLIISLICLVLVFCKDIAAI